MRSLCPEERVIVTAKWNRREAGERGNRTKSEFRGGSKCYIILLYIYAFGAKGLG